MSCQDVEDRLSDHLEGALEAIPAAEVARHLDDCGKCRHLLEAMRELSESMRQTEDVILPEGLAERVARTSWERGRRRRERSRQGRESWWLWGLRLAAAVLFIAAGAILIASRPKVGQAEADVTRISTQVVNAGVYLGERSERLMEDLRMLRLIARTAFEGRLDQMSERVDDYRKLIERRRDAEPSDKKSEDSRTPPGYRT